MTTLERLIIAILCICIGGVFMSYADPLTYQIKSSDITANDTAAKLPGTALIGRTALAITNLNTSVAILYIGNATVNTTNGFPLDSSTPSVSIDIDHTVDIYGITNGTEISVRVLEGK